MKATIEFNLDDPEDRRHYILMNQAEELQIAIDDIWSFMLRPNNKNGYYGPIKEIIDKDPDLCYDLIEAFITMYESITSELKKE
jgi:hypothetical protein